MFEDCVAEVPSFWASMSSWFTPTVFFLLLNVMIGTIALTSTLANQTKHHTQTDVSQDHKLNLARSPSLLQRVRSINFHGYKQQQQQPSLGTKTVFTSDVNTEMLQNHAESDGFFSFENTHNQEMLQNPSHYIFEETQKESAPVEHHSRFDYFQQHSQENGELMNTQYDFEQTQELNNRFDYFDQHHQENGEVMNTHYGFEQTQDSSGGHQENTESRSHHLAEESIGKELEEAEENYGEDGDELQSLEEVYSKVTGHHVSRTKSDTLPSAGEVPVKLTRKMRKSASMKSPFMHFEAQEIVETRRPATVRERVAEPDEEVDVKADDFINKFKQQLKLQRIDSIARYKEMITRGSAK